MAMLFLDDLRFKKQLYEMHGDKHSMLKIIMTDGTSAGLLYRGMRWCARRRLLPLAWLCQVLNKWFNQCVVGVHADFGPGFLLVHPVGTVINSKVRGGSRIVVESGVVIGDEKGASPILGNEIFIGAGAKVIGGIKVGSGSKIGANAVVLADVPPGATVVGIPARVVRQSAA
jgi:serine O-acetyltransferase